MNPRALLSTKLTLCSLSFPFPLSTLRAFKPFDESEGPGRATLRLLCQSFALIGMTTPDCLSDAREKRGISAGPKGFLSVVFDAPSGLDGTDAFGALVGTVEVTEAHRGFQLSAFVLVLDLCAFGFRVDFRYVLGEAVGVEL